MFINIVFGGHEVEKRLNMLNDRIVVPNDLDIFAQEAKYNEMTLGAFLRSKRVAY